jgi:predicted XRE-type DNA-binding protein
MTDVPSGNVFADLGPEAEIYALKVVRQIGELMAEAGLTHAEAAARMGMSEADLTKILKGKIEPLALEQLVGFLAALRQSLTVECGPVPIASVLRRDAD